MNYDFENPLVSIGIPIFNAEHNLANLLNQLIKQDYKNIEIIISDNCSTDNSEKIAKEFSEKYKNIKYFRNKLNLGGNFNFNKVLEISNGDYFCWSSSKNIYKSNFVSKCVETFSKNKDAVLCIPSVNYSIEGSDSIICISELNNLNLQNNLVSRYKEVLFNFNMVGIYGMFRKKTLNKINKIPQILGGDTTFIQELTLFGPFIKAEEALLTYVSRKNWNNIDQDYNNLFYNKKKSFWYKPIYHLILKNLSNLFKNNNISNRNKIFITIILVNHFFFKIYSKLYSLILIKLFGEKKHIIDKLYYKFKYNKGIKIIDEKKFYLRFIVPQILNRK